MKFHRWFFILWGYVVLAPVVNAQGAETRLLIMGDSVTAGYNLPHEWAFPAKLEEALRADGLDVKVINGSVSGDTSAGGLSRLEWVLGDKPHIVVLELGGNDGLRGTDPAQTKKNLTAIVQRFEKEGVTVMLAGMFAPPNLGKDYASEFNTIYPNLAKTYGLTLYPFILDGVLDTPAHLQPDGIHPNKIGVEVMVARIQPYIVKVMEAAKP